MTTHRFGEFAIVIGFEGNQAILGVAGDLDALTAPTLSAVVRAVLEQGHSDVVLDFGRLAFIGAAGLWVIIDASTRLRETSGVLTVRSASAHTRRIFDLTGVSAIVRMELSDPLSTLGAEQLPGDTSGTRPPVPLLPLFPRVGQVPASTEVIDAALRRVVELAKATVDGADGVSVSLERNGQLTTVAASNDTVLRMDAHQYETGEGPCVAAAIEGHWFHVESLAEEHRWPAFIPLAMHEDIGSILSSPLLGTERPIGALNIYSSSERAFGPPEQELAALFATQASGILVDAGSDLTDGQLAARITDALMAREVIAQAQGVLMARHHMSAKVAATTLHRNARTADQVVRQYAIDVVETTQVIIDPDA